MSDITVMLNTTGDPAVTCEPKQFSANNGNQQIKWTPGQSEFYLHLADRVVEHAVLGAERHRQRDHR